MKKTGSKKSDQLLMEIRDGIIRTNIRQWNAKKRRAVYQQLIDLQLLLIAEGPNDDN
jgi:hypothetical protein